MNFWSPQIHYLVTLIHIFCAVFWLGWMVFLFFILQPVANRVPAISPGRLMKPIQKRVRGIVFWLIPVILLTGLYNMGYRGLLDWTVLTTTEYGHRMLWKLAAASVLLGVYYLAPWIMSKKVRGPRPECHGDHAHSGKKTKVIMHVAAFTGGVIAAYVGITLGG